MSSRTLQTRLDRVTERLEVKRRKRRYPDQMTDLDLARGIAFILHCAVEGIRPEWVQKAKAIANILRKGDS